MDFKLKKETFVETIKLMQKYDAFIDKVQNEFGIELYKCEAVDIAGLFFDQLMQTEFGTAGSDVISWWLYESDDNTHYAGLCNDEEGHTYWDFWYSEEFVPKNSTKSLVNIKTPEELYDFLTEVYLADGVEHNEFDISPEMSTNI